MFEKALVMYMYAETPLHPGGGLAVSEVADLPIQRERHTGFPIIRGSSLKGVLRSAPKGASKDGGIALSDECGRCPVREAGEVREACELCSQIFGARNGAGGVTVTDARVLAFPVRTLKGVFSWITCPLVLDRYRRDLELAGVKANWIVPKPAGCEEAMVCTRSQAEEYVYVEDLQLKCERDSVVDAVAEEVVGAVPEGEVYREVREKLRRDLIVVSDDVFRDLVLFTTEVVTRVKVSPETGTVEAGGLWSEEYLPADTIMYFVILVPSRLGARGAGDVVELLKRYGGRILQVGGGETVGRGFVRVKMVEGGVGSAAAP
nr:type III-B CRISPR module RAMP protein Cmr4 [Candidatus Freyrarchaeum guaymaensis]